MPGKENEISTHAGLEPDSPAVPWKSYGAIKVLKCSTGKRMSWSENRSRLNINTSLFPDEDQAGLAALHNVAGYVGLRQAILTDVDVVLNLARQYPQASGHIFRWQGLARLRESDPEALKTSFTVPPVQSLTQEFHWAVDAYVATGRYPDQLSGPVRQAVDNIPRAEGLSLIDYITSGRYLKFDGKNYMQFIRPITDRLNLVDAGTEMTQRQEYAPSISTAKKESFDKSEILASIKPFCKGYFREYVYYFDPVSRSIVKDAGIKKPWSTGEIPEDEETWKTRKKYEGVIKSEGDTILILPYDALPLDTTRKSAKGLRFYRDDTGIIYLDKDSKSSKPGSNKFSFDFVTAETEVNRLNIPPTGHELNPTGWELHPETQNFIDDLSGQNMLSNIQKAQEVSRWIKNKLRYPKNQTEINLRNVSYRSSGDNLWHKIIETGVADCYWSNLLRDELCKRLGIGSRTVGGPHIRDHDKRYESAVVDAKGLTKHAWGEVWDAENGIWINKGMDATPGDHDDDESEDQKADDKSAGQKPGEDKPEEQSVKPEEIEELYNKIQQNDKNQNGRQPTPDHKQTMLSKKDIGLAWKRLEDWIVFVNKTIVPAAYSIRHRPSTLHQEWDFLLEDLYSRREIPVRKYKGPVRESEGDILDDDATVFIDVKSNDPDPEGYIFLDKKTEEQVTVSAFDDDFILDISGSMSGKPAYEQRRMVLSRVYNMKNLNEKLNHSSRKYNMHTPLRVRSRVAVCGDWTRTIQESTKPLNEESLVSLDNSLQDYTQTSVGLAESLKQYNDSLEPVILQKIKKGTYKKVLTIVSDGEVTNKNIVIERIAELRAKGIIIQGIGFGKKAQDIKKICHDPNDPNAAVVIEDITQAPIVHHKMLMRHLSKI